MHACICSGVGSGLDNTGMQVQVVRHDCGPQNADCSIQGVSISNDAGLGNEPFGNLSPLRLGCPQLVPKAASDDLQDTSE